jgi:N4-(beta-N-acetylglucosaminyl)-L-asparaginase
MKRREFLSAAAMGTVATLSRSAAVMAQRPARPVVIASVNGHFFRNGGPKTVIETAWEMMARGSDVLDALIAGVNIDELDPADPYVGYGGLPNAEGVVELDASVMHGPKKRAGAVASLEGVRTPSLVAKAVMEQTDHHLLVGKGAQNFAHGAGFTIEPDLNTDYSRKAWMEWKAKKDAFVYSTHMYGTIHCSGVNAAGDICGVTSTSGRAFKIPGRVGDSPILGAGLYVDNSVGAAGSTGRGEANLFSLASHLVVEGMRAGKSPKDAGFAALRRIRANTVEPRLRKANGDPNFNILFFIVNARGEHAGVAMYGEDEGERGYAGQTNSQFARYSVCDEKGPRIVNVDGLLPGTPQK